jgi:hypothetical protein
LDRTFTNFSYVGTFLPRAVPLVQTLFAALGDLRKGSPRLVERLRLDFLGTSNQPDGAGGHRVHPYAEAAGVGDLVRETPARAPFLEALAVLANSDALLLIGSDEAHYTASKIYPGLMSGRPFLSLFHARSSAHAILSAAGGGIALGFDSADELARLRPVVADALRTLITEPAAVARADPAAYAPYTAHAVAGQFAAIFDRVAAP